MGARTSKGKEAQKIAVIITAFNYEDHIEGAIRSVLQQTHQNFEIVIVDDHSAPASSAKTAKIVKAIKDDRITLLRNEANMGQTHSFYLGLDHTTAEFVCLLDPDDRYLPEFLATMLAAHLNPIHIAPLAFSNQQLTRGDHIQLTGNKSNLLVHYFETGQMDKMEASLRRFGFSSYEPPFARGWIWTSTSSMMFRRDALEMIRPLKRLPNKANADTYMANGAHLCGGSLFVHTVLLSRTIHDKNDFSNGLVFASDQIWGESNFQGANPLLNAAEALFESGNYKFLRRKTLQKAIVERFKATEILNLWWISRNFRVHSRGRFIFLRNILTRLRRK